MFAKSTTPPMWVVIQLSDVIPTVHTCLALSQAEARDYWHIDVEDIVSSAVFQLNGRERPLVIDDLVNLYKQDDQVDDSLSDFLSTAVRQVYDRLSPIVPGNMEVQHYEFVGDDIMIGGMLF